MKRLLVIVSFVIGHSSLGQVPSLINYQGRLLDGTNLVNGNVGLSLRIFDAPSAGNRLYEDSNTVTVVDGLYATFLGDNTTTGTLATALQNTNTYIEVMVNGTALAPRERIAAVAYATHAWGLSGNAGTAAGTHFVGTTDNQPFEIKAQGRRAFRVEPASNAFYGLVVNLIGGHGANTTTSHGVTIAGGGSTGYPNRALSPFTTIGGGVDNTIEVGADHSTIAGGGDNHISTGGFYSTIGGGINHVIGTNAGESTIGGGNSDTIGLNSFDSTIAGGVLNTISNDAPRATIGGGSRNAISSLADSATIGGGDGNTAGGPGATIGGGGKNGFMSEGNKAYAGGSTIGGGSGNLADSNALDAVIAGGRANNVRAQHGTVAGGVANIIGQDSQGASVGGGFFNFIDTNVPYGAIGGGDQNVINSGASNAVIAGGLKNEISTNATFAVIPGGQSNSVTAPFGFAAGRRAGAHHRGVFIWADSQNADFRSSDSNQFLIRAGGGVGIGLTNPVSALHVRRDGDGGFTPNANSIAVVERNASGFLSILTPSTTQRGILFGDEGDESSGGVIYNNANGQGLQFRAGGNSTWMTITSNGLAGIGTTSPEALLHVLSSSAGTVTASTAATVVIEDGVDTFLHFLTPNPNASGILFGNPAVSVDASIRYNSTSSRELAFRTANSVRMTITSNGFVAIGAVTPTGLLHVAGNAYATAFLPSSDRNLKENIAPVDAHAVLEKIAELPVAQWNFKSEPGVVHMGPMAQDFKAAFGLGPNDTTIPTVDADGVALASIQALYRLVQEQQKQIEELERKLESAQQP